MSPSRKPWRTALAVTSLLAIGAAGGIAIDRVVQAHRPAGEIDLRAVHEDPLGTIERVIDLRPDQRPRIAMILSHRQAFIDSVWHETNLQLDATLDSLIHEIVVVLDSAQAARFLELAEQLHGRSFPR